MSRGSPIPGDHLENEQERHKALVRERLERMWKYNEAHIRSADHELIIIAVPRYPADLEAVSAMDLSDIADIMATFAKKRSEDDGTEQVERVEREGEAAPAEAGQARDRDRIETIPDHEGVGPRDDGGGAPQERAEPAPEPHEGDAATDAMELMPNLPVFELCHGVEANRIRIWADGHVDGFDGVIVNRIPHLVMELARKSMPIPKPIVAEFSQEDIERLEKEWMAGGNFGHVTFIKEGRTAPTRFGEPIWPDNDQSNDLDVEPLPPAKP